MDAAAWWYSDLNVTVASTIELPGEEPDAIRVAVVECRSLPDQLTDRLALFGSKPGAPQKERAGIDAAPPVAALASTQEVSEVVS